MRPVELQKLHSGQLPVAELIRDNSRVVIRCGRRFGKTLLLERIAAKRSYLGQRIGWFGPQYKLNTPTYRRLARVLEPVTASRSKVDQVIETSSGGSVEFWTLENEDAGRSRFYDLAIIDEASLVKDGLRDIWEQSIAPTLLDRGGSAIMAGTPKGIDQDNYFYLACTNPALHWVPYHAPTAANPILDAEAVARLKDEYPPLVYQQEYLAEFVDWKGSAFFAESSLLEDGKPVELANRCDYVFATIDTAMKDGAQHDGTAVVYWARNHISGPPLVILDWDVLQIEGSLLINWLPSVDARLKELGELHKARRGSAGMWIEDKASGITLLQQARRANMQAEPIDGQLVAMGKEGRALNASGYVYQGKVRISKAAHDKLTNYKGDTRNHLISQVCGFRMGQKDGPRDLLDCFTYGVAIGLGNSEGY